MTTITTTKTTTTTTAEVEVEEAATATAVVVVVVVVVVGKDAVIEKARARWEIITIITRRKGRRRLLLIM